MTDTIIRVENLGKRYRIGLKDRQPETWLEAAVSLMGSPFRYLRQMSRPPTEAETLWALKDISFEVRRGEAVGIVGRNGAGKSTLLKILSRITEPTEGRAIIHGRIGSLLEVGTGFHPELTGRENVFLNGGILGMKKREIHSKFDEIVDFAGVEKFIDTPVKRYSSGMSVRLAFAVAAHLDTDILIVDEVLAVGDYEFQNKCLGKMQDVSKMERTVLLVSHNIAHIAALCNRVILLKNGRIASVGETRNVISEYIQSNAQSQGEVSWLDIEQAPGNHMVRLRRVRVLSGGVPSTHVVIDKPIVIEIEYWNLGKGSFLIPGLEVKDRMRVYVFASNNRRSANLSVDEWYGKSRPVGVYRTTCTIPANFLNTGWYSVDLGVANTRNEWEVHMQDTISFVVHDTGEMTKEYWGPWLGVVRPRLPWATTFLGKD